MRSKSFSRFLRDRSEVKVTTSLIRGSLVYSGLFISERRISFVFLYSIGQKKGGRKCGREEQGE